MSNLKTSLKINQLILSNVYLGDDRKYFNSRLRPYILGYIKKIHILNISYSLIQLKLLFKIITNIIALRQRILIVKELDTFQLHSLLKLRQVFYYDKKWIAGALTNHKRVRVTHKFIGQYQNSKDHLGTCLASLRYMPSLVFFIDINLSYWAFHESLSLEIPVAAIINNTSKGVEYVDYPVVGNNKVFESIYFYFTFLRNAVLLGHQKQRLKILRIL